MVVLVADGYAEGDLDTPSFSILLIFFMVFAPLIDEATLPLLLTIHQVCFLLQTCRIFLPGPCTVLARSVPLPGLYTPLLFFFIDSMTYEEKSNKSLVNFLLNGDNYLNWARAIRLALGGQSKLEHILGRTKSSGKDPLTDEEKQRKEVEWEMNDLRIMSRILNSIEPKLYGIFAYTNTSKELWDSIFEM